MGGASFTFRAATKLEVWLQLAEWLQDERDEWSTVDPSGKKQAKRKMERDPETGEWVLWVRCQK